MAAQQCRTKWFSGFSGLAYREPDPPPSNTSPDDDDDSTFRFFSFSPSPLTLHQFKMSAKVESKKFGKGTRSVPHHSEKAQKWYPAEADAQPRKVRLRFARDENFLVVEELGTYGREDCGNINGLGGDE